MHPCFISALFLLNSGINLCPVNEDDQPVPKSLIRLMKGAELLKKGQQEKRPIPAHSGAALHHATTTVACYTGTVIGCLQSHLIPQHMVAYPQSHLQLRPQAGVQVVVELENVPCL